MVMNEMDSLYSWYHRVKQKDLGETRLDWLKYLQDKRALSVGICPVKENASSTNKEDLQRCDVKGKSTATANTIILEKLVEDKDGKDDGFVDKSQSLNRDVHGDSLLKKSDVISKTAETAEREVKMKMPLNGSSSPSVFGTPHQEHKSPFSTFFDKSFVTPPPLISYEDAVSLDESVASSVYSPTVPMVEFFSPAKSDGNTTNDVMASLGGNFNESPVLWTSALATPCSGSDTEGRKQTNSPSTLERVTLHPKRGLRQKVMARSLFSPCTPGGQTSSSDEGSPNLGIIKCHSPLPVFKVKDDIVEKENSPIVDCQRLRVEGTQTFEIVEGKEPFFERDMSVSDFSERIGNSPAFVKTVVHSLHDNKSVRKCKTSTPLVKTNGLSCSSNAEVCDNEKSTNNCSSVDFGQNKISEVKAVGPLNIFDVAAENSEDVGACPFDIICSPIKKKLKGIETDCADTVPIQLNLSWDLERPGKSTSIGCDINSGQSLCARTEKIEKMPTDRQEFSLNQAQVIKNHGKFAESQLNLHEKQKNRNYETTLTEVDGCLNHKFEIHHQLPNSETQNLDPNQNYNQENIISIQSENNEDPVSSRKHSISDFSKGKVDRSMNSHTPLLKNEEIRVDIAATTSTVPLKPSDESGKMSLFRKRKRTSGTFLYPTKSVTGDEKLSITFSKKLMDTLLNQGDSNSSVVVPATTVDISRKLDPQTSGMVSNQAKLPSEMESSTNVQHSFIPQASLNKNQKLQENSSGSGSGIVPQRNIVGDISPMKEERRISAASSPSSSMNINVIMKNTLEASSSRLLANKTEADGRVKEKRPVKKQNHCSENRSPEVYKSAKMSDGSGKFINFGKVKGSEMETFDNVGCQVVPVMAVFDEEPLVVKDPAKDTLLEDISNVESGEIKQNQASQYWNDSLNEADLAELDLEMSRLSKMSPPKISAVAGTPRSDGNLTSFGKEIQASPTMHHQAQIFEDVNVGVDNKADCDKHVSINPECKVIIENSMRNSLQTSEKEKFKTSDQAQSPRDIQQYSYSESLNSPNPVAFSFRKASGTLITVSADALKKAKALLEEANVGEDLIEKEESFSEVQTLSKDVPDSSKSGFQVFKAAGGTSVPVNKKLPEKVKQLRHEENGGCSVSHSTDGNCDIADAKISKAENHSNAVELNIGADKRTLPSMKAFQGSVMAAGSKVKASEESLVRVQMFQKESEDNDSDFGTAKCERLPLVTVKKSPLFEGFSTASGSKIMISEVSLKKAQLMWDETPSDNVGETSWSDSLVQQELSREHAVQKSAGHQHFSASDRKAKASNESLKKVKKLGEESENGCSFASVTASYKGFSAAAGSKVKVSEDPLKKVQALTDEDVTGVMASLQVDVERPTEKSKIFQGFFTSTKSEVRVSEASLRKVQMVMDENMTVEIIGSNVEEDEEHSKSLLINNPVMKSRLSHSYNDKMDERDNVNSLLTEIPASQLAFGDAKVLDVQSDKSEDIKKMGESIKVGIKQSELTKEIVLPAKEAVETSSTLDPISHVVQDSVMSSRSGNCIGSTGKTSNCSKRISFDVFQEESEKRSVINTSETWQGVEEKESESVEDENQDSAVQPSKSCKATVQGSNVVGDFEDARVGQPSKFPGFSTANGKEMVVSKSSLNYIKNIFMAEDIAYVARNCQDLKDYPEVIVTEKKANDDVESDHDNQKIITERKFNDVSTSPDNEKDSSCGISANYIKQFDNNVSTGVQHKSSGDIIGKPNDVADCEGTESEGSLLGKPPQEIFIEEEEEATSMASFIKKNKLGNEELKSTINEGFGDDDGDRSLSPILGSQSCYMKKNVAGAVNTKKRKSNKTTSSMMSDSVITDFLGRGGFDELAPLNIDNTIKKISATSHSPNDNKDKGNSTILRKPKTHSKPHSQPAGCTMESFTVPTREARSQTVCQYIGPTMLNKTETEREGPPSDTLEISNMTEAFLKDESWEMENLVRKKRKTQEIDEEDIDRPAVKVLKRETDFHQSVDLQCTNISVDQAVLEVRELIRMKQENIVRYKRKHSIKPIQGLLYKERIARKDKRIMLRSHGILKVVGKVSAGIKAVTGNNASLYRFALQDERVESIDCGEGCAVVPGTDGCVGAAEVELGFLSMPGVSPTLVPTGWVSNHYRWIVWKLAAMERCLLQRKVLTLENLVARLKYRYDREIDRAERPILRKITERDDISQKTMVLCVVSIKGDDSKEVGKAVPNLTSQNSPNKPLLTLTDGWYSIGAVVDKAMLQIISSKKISVGTKLVIHGAELTGPPSPCHPLEAPESLNLQLHTNMTRRARWWSRLGLVTQRSPLPTQLAGVLGDGGIVGRVTVMISRIYPPIYFEKSGGNNVFRGEKAHLRLARENAQCKESILHQIVTEVEKEFEEVKVKSCLSNQRILSLTNEEICGLTMGKDIAQLMENTLDPTSLEGLLSRTQIELARSWQQRQADEKKRRMNAEVQRRILKKQKLYEATPLLKIRLLDQDGSGALLTIWRPSEELRQAISEGMKFNIHYVVAAGYRRGCLQLTATRQTRWERITDGVQISFPEFQRCVTPLCLTMSNELSPAWKEVDVVGVVFRIGQMEQGSQMVHIVDHHVNILVLKFWGGLKDCGVEELIGIESVICISNGSWRGYSPGKCGCVHVTELSAVSICPRSSHLVEAVEHIKDSIKDIKDLLHKADMKLDGQFDERAFLSSGGDDINNKSIAQGNLKTDCTSECPAAGDENQRSNNTNQLSTPKSNRLQERSREVRNKIRALGMYGIPSPLRALPSNSSTLGTHKPFRAPIKQTNQL